MPEATILTSSTLKEEIHVANIGGLAVFFMPKKGFRRKYAEISVRYGSCDNCFIPPGQTDPVTVPPGIAHFLEHKMFEKPWGEAFSAFARIGASANAFTGTNYTSYLFWTLENFEDALRLLFEVVFRPYFTDDSVKKEQGIISQEIRMYEDDPSSRLVRETLEALYVEHPVRLDIAGTEESIRQIDTELLYLCHRVFYNPDNMKLYIAGDLEPSRVFDLVSALMSEYSPCSSGSPRRLRPREPRNVRPEKEIRLSVPTPLVQIGWKLEPPGEESRLTVLRAIAVSMMLNIVFGKSSGLFMKVYEKGLIDDLSYSYEVWPDYAHVLVGAESPSPETLSEIIWDEIEKLKRCGLDEIDFRRTKKAAAGRFVSLFDSMETIGELQMQLWDIGENVFSYEEMLQEVAFDHVMDQLRCLERTCSSRVVVRPRAMKGDE